MKLPMAMNTVGQGARPFARLAVRAAFSWVLGWLVAATVWAQPAVPSLGLTPSGRPYGARFPAKPGPLALVFASDIRDSLNDKFSPLALSLAAAGYVVASMDAPCHGQDQPGMVAKAKHRLSTGRAMGDGLACWASQIEATPSDYFAPFLQGVSAMLTQLKSDGRVSGTRVVAIGISRGGYLALRAAAADPRITDVVLLAPVTDLSRLTEFSGKAPDPGLYGLDRHHVALAGKRIFLQIGSHDGRVGTLESLNFVKGVLKSAGANKVDLTLLVTPLDGHHTAEHERAFAWITACSSGQGACMPAGQMPPK